MSFIHRAKHSGTLTNATARLLTGFAARLAIVLIVLGIASLTGLPAALDAALRHHYYGLRGARSSQQNVLLVAADEDTVAAWGAPPWSWDRYSALYGAIAAGKPKVVAVIEPAARVLPAASKPAPAAIIAAVASGALVLPASERAGQPALDVSAAGPVDAVRLRNDAPTVTARVLARAGLSYPGERLPINFLGSARQGGGGLPTLPAHRIAAGDIPAAAFAGKIVIFGVTAPAFAGSVPTPVGAMAPAQVQAQALLSLTDGATWHARSPLVCWLLALLCAAATLLLVPRFYAAGAILAAGALGAGVLLLDYSLFASGAALLGASLPVLAVVTASAAARVHERVGIHRKLGEIGRWMRQNAMTGNSSKPAGLRGDASADDEAFWQRASELARLYFDCRSSIVAELPQEKWHVRLRVISGVTSDQITERRRDVRRNPYRKAHLTLSPVWHPQFMAQRSGLGTLIVPLVAHARLYGFWLLNFQADVAPDAQRLQLVQKLAHEIALALARRDLRSTRPRDAGQLERLLGEGRFADDLDQLGRAIAAERLQAQEMTKLGEHLPLGVLVATLWGEIRYMNTAMKQLCGEHGIDAAAAHGLPDLIHGFTGMALGGVHAALGRLVREPQELRFFGRADGAAYDYVLARLGESARAGETGEQLLLVCALPHVEANDRRDRAQTVGQPARAIRSLGSAPPSHHEEEVTVLRSPLPPPPTEPEPLQPPQTAPHARIEPDPPAPAPLATMPPLPRPRTAAPPPLPPLPQVVARRRGPANKSEAITLETAAIVDEETRAARPPRRG